MDRIDFEIIKILTTNGRESHEEIGRKLNISRPAVHQRVKKLESEGIIKFYTAEIDWSKMGQELETLIFCKINSPDFKEVANKIINIEVPNVYLERSYRLSGDWHLMIKIRTNDPQNVTKYIDKLWAIGGIKETSTTFILSKIYENGIKNY